MPKLINLVKDYSVSEIGLILFAFSIPFTTQLNTWMLFATFISLFAKKNLYQLIKSIRFDPLTLGFMVYYFSFIIQVIINPNSTNLKQLEIEASFLALPVLWKIINPKTELKSVLGLAFLSGVMVAMSFCLSIASFKALQKNDITQVFYHHLAGNLGINAIYMALLCTIALLVLQQNSAQITFRMQALLSLILLGFIVLLSSKFLLVIFLLFLLLEYKRYKIILVTLPILTALFVFLNPFLLKRIKTEFATPINLVKQDKFSYDTPFTGSTLRLVIWKNTLEVLTEKNAWILGLGKASMHELLNKKYHQKGMYMGNPDLKDTGYFNYGPHNQYLESLMNQGILGILTLLYLLLLLVKESFMEKSNRVQRLALLFALLFITESVLTINKGIVAFVFFSLLFTRQSSTSIKTAESV